MKYYYIYILATKKNGVLYIGLTDNLIRRVSEHRQGIKCVFTKRYSVHKLVYYETTTNVMSAIHRERRLKEWHRQWKIDLIEKANPNWDDLAPW